MFFDCLAFYYTLPAILIFFHDKMSSEIRAALVGACGRMGTMIVRRLMSTEGITVSAAFDLVRVGDDIGEVAGIGKIGVPVSDAKDLEKVLKEICDRLSFLVNVGLGYLTLARTAETLSARRASSFVRTPIPVPISSMPQPA